MRLKEQKNTWHTSVRRSLLYKSGSSLFDIFFDCLRVEHWKFFVSETEGTLTSGKGKPQMWRLWCKTQYHIVATYCCFPPNFEAILPHMPPLKETKNRAITQFELLFLHYISMVTWHSLRVWQRMHKWSEGIPKLKRWVFWSFAKVPRWLWM